MIAWITIEQRLQRLNAGFQRCQHVLSVALLLSHIAGELSCQFRKNADCRLLNLAGEPVERMVAWVV